MKKLIFGLIASVLLSVNGFANVKMPKSLTTLEINNVKTSLNIKLGNVSNLTEKQIIELAERLIERFVKLNKNNLDECSITMSAEVTIGVVTVNVSVTYTATNCADATSKCIKGLRSAVAEIRKTMSIN